ncbi:hypothetical protein CLV47_12353 [Antricoccus suffuscus]|uniref:Uncharacterized protein n=1 Tax=Antricoccus suffuscus TaxID=1629062 RepID=A0A2T0ZET9_9ACTN|nr:hypothetical protein CLV47_12353 [Antricoccus suffuscus]
MNVEEIKKRVEQADRKRIQARAEAAALVGQRLTDRAAAQEHLKQTDTDLAAAISGANELMNLAELASFVDSSVSKLTAASKVRTPRKPRKESGTPASGSNHQPGTRTAPGQDHGPS